MSSRYERSRQFEPGAPEVSEWSDARGIPEADLMRGLQLASDTVLRLATQTHAAVARGDAASAELARASLEKQLALTTRLIDELLFDGEDSHTTH
ncbi:hypothetical protein J8I87_07810 [Paraburkholderia sp. LEh10]|jgi:hypothetical protein|uniref:hypothetical protein n=1 Tax=Paraburkholderia sp. LEh10 TaxID=2821353 RepID=UPI001AEAC555|nr:hypothetical protein [Paraburkholderia sp. LEh10]MBP0589625.1 hypothetical protein [Paraburkholderia sp. LEh10]